jgi:hypothetical protein
MDGEWGCAKARYPRAMLSVVLALAVTAPSPASSDPNGTGDRAKPLRIGVSAIEATDMDPILVKIVEESLLVELRKLQRTNVIGMSEIRRMLDLEADKQTLGCSGDNQSCLVEIADAVGVDTIVVGSLARVGNETVLGLKRIDQRDAKASGTTRRVPTGDGEEVLALVGPAVADVFPDVPLRTGETRGVSAETARRLNPPPLPAFVPFALGGVAIVALVATTGAAVLWQVKQAEYKDIAAGKTIDGSALVSAGNDAVILERSMWTLLGAAVVLSAATAVSIPFTNFEPDEEAP